MTARNPNSPETASLTAVNTFTTPAFFHGPFAVRVRGTFVATVSLQRSDDGGINYDEVTTFISPDLKICTEPALAGGLYRIGPTAYTSGTIDVSLGG